MKNTKNNYKKFYLGPVVRFVGDVFLLVVCERLLPPLDVDGV
jgi:hypothetical protein